MVDPVGPPRPRPGSELPLVEQLVVERADAARNRQAILESARRLVATEGTAEVLRRNGIEVGIVAKYSEKADADSVSVVELINRSEIDIVINTPSGGTARADGYEIRAAAGASDIPLFTTIAELSAAVGSIDAVRNGFEVTSLQEYAIQRAARA